MKLAVATILTALVAFISGLFLPWWGIAIAALLVAVLVHQKPGKAFLAGFLGLFILWALLATIINIQNKGLLAAKMASILPLGGKPALIIIVTGIVGGLVAGFGALSGSYLRASSR